jgi:hypothetical protein
MPLREIHVDECIRIPTTESVKKQKLEAEKKSDNNTTINEKTDICIDLTNEES